MVGRVDGWTAFAVVGTQGWDRTGGGGREAWGGSGRLPGPGGGVAGQWCRCACTAVGLVDLVRH